MRTERGFCLPNEVTSWAIVGLELPMVMTLLPPSPSVVSPSAKRERLAQSPKKNRDVETQRMRDPVIALEPLNPAVPEAIAHHLSQATNN